MVAVKDSLMLYQHGGQHGRSMIVKRMMGITDIRDGKGFGLGNVIGWDYGVEDGTIGVEMGVDRGRGIGCGIFLMGLDARSGQC